MRNRWNDSSFLIHLIHLLHGALARRDGVFVHDGTSTNGQGITLQLICLYTIQSCLSLGSPFIISNLDVEAVSTNGYGIYATSGDGLSIASTLEGGNTITVNTKKVALNSFGTGMSIKNCSLNVESEEEGLYTTGYQGLTIEGGQVKVKTPNDYKGIKSVCGNITLSWTHPDDFIKASSYYVPNGFNICIAHGVLFKNGDDATQLFSGSIEDTRDGDGNVTSCAIDGLKLVMPVIENEDGTYVEQTGANDYKVSIDETLAPAAVIENVPGGNAAELAYQRILQVPSSEEDADAEIDGSLVNLYTICLPTAPDAHERLTYYTLSSTEGNVLSFSEVETPAAKTPYMVAAKGAEGIAWLFNLENIALWEDVSTNDVTVGNYVFKGTLTGMYNEDAEGLYILQSSGRWGQVPAGNASVYIPPFRAYIESVDGAPAHLRSAFDGAATGISKLRLVSQDGTETWHDLNGHRIAQPVKAGVYVKDGKKVLVK